MKRKDFLRRMRSRRRQDQAIQEREPERRRATDWRTLRLQLPQGMDFDKGVVPTLRNLVKSYSIILVESTAQGSRTELMLSVRPRSDVPGSKLIEELSKVDDNIKATYNYALHTEDL